MGTKDVAQILANPVTDEDAPAARKLPQCRAVPWNHKTLEGDIWSMGTTSRAGNKYVLLVVDHASRFPSGLPLPSKGTKDVTRILANLELTFGVPIFVATAEENFGQKS